MKTNIVVTGASSEIGRAICETLSNHESKLIVQGSRHLEKCKYLKGSFGSFEAYASDFNDPESLKEFCGKITRTDILINAAASIHNEALPFQSAADIDRMIAVNIRSLIYLHQAVLPGMAANRRGVIVNISSVTASRGNRGQAVYAGTKGFMESFSRAVAAEYGKKGIRINCVAPGPIDSGSLKETLTYASENVKRLITLQRLGRPEDVAAMVGFLVSDDAAFITGQSFSVDGGFSGGV